MFSKTELKYMRWYDWLWLLIPMTGLPMMVAFVSVQTPDRKRKA